MLMLYDYIKLLLSKQNKFIKLLHFLQHHEQLTISVSGRPTHFIGRIFISSCLNTVKMSLLSLVPAIRDSFPISLTSLINVLHHIIYRELLHFFFTQLLLHFFFISTIAFTLPLNFSFPITVTSKTVSVS